MVADESGDIQKAYGVPTKFLVLSARVTFLVGPDGKILHVWPDVDPAVDAQHVLEVAAQVESGKTT
jgi:peroxiredoxin